MEVRRTAPSRQSLVYLISLCSVLMFGVLAFGAAEMWAQCMLEILATLLCTAVVIHKVSIAGSPVRWNPLFLPALGFAAVIVIQFAFDLTAYRYVTLLPCMQYVAYGALLFTASQIAIDERASSIVVLVFGAFGSAVSLFAICQYLSSSPNIYWLRSPETGTNFFGPYINRNHYAGLMEMLTPFAVALSLSRLVRGGQRILAAFAAVLMAASILLSGSRGGTISLAFQLLLLSWIVSKDQDRTLTRTRMLLLIASLLVFLILVGSPGLNHFVDLQDTFRVDVLKDSLRMFARRPLLGWGLGTFSTVYPGFRSFYTTLFVNAAHNDYLQVLVETGIFGFGCAIWFLLVLYRNAVTRQGNDRRGWRGVLRIAAMVGCTGMVVHSALDFNLQIPANAAWFYVLCVLATSSRKDEKGLMRNPATSFNTYKREVIVVASR